MNNLANKDLIHPVTRGTYKEPVYKDFVPREEFINRTGIFVSPDYFEYIYDMEFKKSGVGADEFIRNYEAKYSTCIQEIPLQGIFKYEVMDDELNCASEYDECYEPNIWEIVNALSRNSKAEFEKRYDAIEKYNSVLERCATEIVGNEALKDIWDISLNQLKMISNDLGGNIDSFKQIGQEEKEK